VTPQATPAADLVPPAAKPVAMDLTTRRSTRDQGSGGIFVAGTSPRSHGNDSATSARDAVLCAHRSVSPSLATALIWDVINSRYAKDRSAQRTSQSALIDTLLESDGATQRE
jgi:hypothetical protein